jgi:hypothetical protein
MSEEYVIFSSVVAYELRFRELQKQDAIFVRVDLLVAPNRHVRAHLPRNWNERNYRDFRHFVDAYTSFVLDCCFHVLGL